MIQRRAKARHDTHERLEIDPAEARRHQRHASLKLKLAVEQLAQDGPTPTGGSCQREPLWKPPSIASHRLSPQRHVRVRLRGRARAMGNGSACDWERHRVRLGTAVRAVGYGSSCWVHAALAIGSTQLLRLITQPAMSCPPAHDASTRAPITRPVRARSPPRVRGRSPLPESLDRPTGQPLPAASAARPAPPRGGLGLAGTIVWTV
jgi:hypothetical protein